jgi:hypothetical protein
MNTTSPHLADIDGEMTPKAVVKALMPTGRLDGLNELFVSIIAMVICERKLWQVKNGGESRILEWHLDAAVRWLERKCGEYQ